MTEVNAHTYYSSKGLNGAEIIKVGTINQALWRKEDYGNDYCKVYWEPYSEKGLNQIVDIVNDGTQDMIQEKGE